MNALPKINLRPEFLITRASHVVLHVTDLDASQAFWADTLGFIVTRRESDSLYLRGLGETAHHSLVLQKSQQVGCARIGFRVYMDQDLDLLATHLKEMGVGTDWIDVPYQGRTLRTTDRVGTPLEFCASMDVVERFADKYSKYHGAAVQRFDHMQILTPEVINTAQFYGSLGFRLSEYIADDVTDEMLFAFMQRKGNPHDLAIVTNNEPKLHHFGMLVSEVRDLFMAADVAASNGFGSNVEYGPERHFGPSNAPFLYLRDPDGHRVELFTDHYQAMDLEVPPVRWDRSSVVGLGGWGTEPPESWNVEASGYVDDL
ncbi:VOC family protein [Rhodococcus koreensis]